VKLLFELIKGLSLYLLSFLVMIPSFLVFLGSLYGLSVSIDIHNILYLIFSAILFLAGLLMYIKS
jgi:hypothetical protein